MKPPWAWMLLAVPLLAVLFRSESTKPIRSKPASDSTPNALPPEPHLSSRSRAGTSRKTPLRVAQAKPEVSRPCRELPWLMESQAPDGLWGDGPIASEEGILDRVGITSLVLLAYLGAGYTHSSKEFGPVIRRGLDWLRGQQRPDGGFETLGSADASIAALALCEAHGLTAAEPLLSPAERAISSLQFSRGRDDAWSMWDAMALTSARLAGLEVSTDAVEAAVKRFRVRLASGPDAKTALGLRLLLREASDSALSETVSRLSQGSDTSDPMLAYPASLLLFQSSPKVWKDWEKRRRRQTPAWTPGLPDSAGIVRAAYSMLLQEIYYRDSAFTPDR